MSDFNFFFNNNANLKTLQVLLTIIWLRRYPTFYHLAHHFSVPVSLIHETIYKMIPILHGYLVPKFIKWHDANTWISLRNTFREWPNVVGVALYTCQRSNIS